jgi:DNA-binding CsgD family transcriptional regulator
MRVLETVLGEPGAERVLALVDEAVAAGFLESLEDGTGSCRFTHALLEEAIYGVTPVAERALLHAQIAAALESEYADSCDDHAEELARQLSGALGAADAGKLAYYHRVAGERALSTYAFPEAEAHFQAAIAALPFFSCAPVHADLLFGLGKAKRRLGDQEGAAEALTRAFALYIQAGATEKARTLAAYPWGAFARSRDIRAVPEMYTAALEIAEKDTLNEAYILVNVVESSYYGGDERLQRDRLLRALDIAQRRNATELSVRILSCLMGVMELMVDGQAAPTYANMAMDLAGQLKNPAVTCLAAQCVCRRDRILNVPVEEYRKHAQDHLNAAAVLRDRLLMEDAHHECMQAAWVVADWKEMRRHVDAMSGLVGNSERNVFVRCRRASIELETGRIAEAKAELQRAVEIAAGPSVSRHERVALSAYLARYSWWLDESLWLSVAEAYALDARRLSASEPRTAYYAAQTLAMIAIIRGDRNAAQQWYQVFTRNSDDNNPRERCLIPAALAMTAGMKDAAIRHLEEGLQDTERRGNLYSRRWILYYLADVLLERNRPGDLQRALSVLEELLQIAERTGSVLVRDRATLLQAQVREALSPRNKARRSDDLTPRELEVLGLIVRGYTNSEIAEALFISPATAATHAYRILHKTGMANRAEVTAWAIRNGVVEA